MLSRSYLAELFAGRRSGVWLGHSTVGKVVQGNYSPGRCSATMPSGRCFGRIANPGVHCKEFPPGYMVPAELHTYSREGGLQRVTLGKMARSNYSRGGDSDELTLRKVVRPNYLLGGGPITLRKVVRPNYLREGGSGKVLPGRWFGGHYSLEGGSAELPSGRWFGEITPREVV